MPPETRPFLPEPEPGTPASPQKKIAAPWKALLLWIFLIMMFLAIWQFLSPSPGAESRPHAPAPDAHESSWLGSFFSFMPMAFLVLIAWWFLRAYRQSINFNLAQEPGRIALAERRFADAAVVFLRNAASHAKRPLYEAQAMHDVAFAHLWAGRFADAIVALAQVERAKGVLFASALRTVAASQLAFVNALAGDLDTADVWAREARKRLAKTKDSRLLAAAYLCLGEATLTIRRGRSAEGRALLEEHWLKLRETLTANMMRVAEIVRAFAEAGGGVREFNVVSERLVRVEPVVQNELAFLGAKWPEMHAFLAAHHLAG